ncbi:MAG: hypothetical protein IPH93_02425 [Saprospiraceae bacterium]|nr:hypothetical protein [Saprospiraceae bacterium]
MHLIFIIIVTVSLFSSCHEGTDVNQPLPDPDPVDSTQIEPQDKLPYANVFYPQDTSKGAMYAIKNNHPRRFAATCDCYYYAKEKPAYIFVAGSTSLDPWPRVYNYEIFGLGGPYPLNYDPQQIPTTYSDIYILKYITVQHDTEESEYRLDTSYHNQNFQFTSIDTIQDRAEGVFNVQYKLYQIIDSTGAANTPSVIRLANGRFWCKLQRR